MQINGFNNSDVNVKDFFIIIVLDLHDLIIWSVDKTISSKPFSLGIQCFLQCHIQIRSTYYTSLHRCQHLNLTGRCMIIPRQVLLHQLNNFLHGLIRIFLCDKEKICILSIGNIRHLPGVDFVGIHQYDINHGALIHDQNITLQRCFFIFLIALR